MASEKRSLRSLIFFLVIAVVIFSFLIFVPRLFDLENYGSNAYKYNHFNFKLVDGIWTTETQEGNNMLLIGLRNGPLDLEDIPVTGSISAFRNSGDVFYITFDPSVQNHDAFVTMSNAEIAPNLVVHMGKEVAPGCITDDFACNSTGTPIITCENTLEPVIYIRRAAENYITVTENCAVISGAGPDLVRAADRFMYGMYGIMQ